MHAIGRMRICPGGDALTGLSTPFTKFAWCLILQQRCGIFKGGPLASSLIKAVSSKRRQEHRRVDLVANLFRQHHGIVHIAPDHRWDVCLQWELRQATMQKEQQRKKTMHNEKQ